MEKFTINISDAVVKDLKCRLAATRRPDDLENAGNLVRPDGPHVVEG